MGEVLVVVIIVRSHLAPNRLPRFRGRGTGQLGQNCALVGRLLKHKQTFQIKIIFFIQISTHGKSREVQMQIFCITYGLEEIEL
jgi:hypothetical protein